MLKAWRNVDRVRLDLIYRRLNIKVKRFLLQNFGTLFWSTDEKTRSVLPHATTFCGLQARRQFKKHDGPFHRWRVFWAAWFPRMSASTIEHLQLHQFCRWYAALSLFSIRDHSYFFTLVKLSCSRLSDSQGEMHAKCSRGGKKVKRNRCPGYTTASRLMNTKPLCLSHLEIDRWKLLWYISPFVNLFFIIIFQLIFPLQEYFFCTSPTPTPITFLMVHLTLRAELPNLLSDAKWSSGKRMNSSAAERVHGPSLSFIQWRIQGRGSRDLGLRLIFRPN